MARDFDNKYNNEQIIEYKFEVFSIIFNIEILFFFQIFNLS